MVKRRSRIRGDVVLVEHDPTKGSEIRKTRPCVVMSPDEMNEHLRTVIVAPMTTGSHTAPFRVACTFGRTSSLVVLDQLRAVDRTRIVRSLGRLGGQTMASVLSVLREMFSA